MLRRSWVKLARPAFGEADFRVFCHDFAGAIRRLGDDA